MDAAAPTPVLSTLVSWFKASLDTPPSRLHVGGVWHDEAGGANLTGAPMLARDFADWMDRPFTKVRGQERCSHEDRGDDGLCNRCVVVEVRDTPDGPRAVRVGERGTREVRRYRWPLRAAIARIEPDPRRPDPLQGRRYRVLSTLARCDGDVEVALRLLPDLDKSDVLDALQAVRDVYREAPPPPHTRSRHPRPKEVTPCSG